MIPILFEDDHVIVISKPSGIVVNNAASVKGKTIQDWAADKLESQISDIKDREHEFVKRSGLAHRLDKETSGCLVIAKHPRSLAHIMAQFKDRSVKKSYKALVHGELVPQEGEINAPIGRTTWNRKRFGVVPGGKSAHTTYHVDETYTADRGTFSLVSLHPTTGRTHQLRVHMTYINHPIVADTLYAGRKIARRDRTWVPRVMLHAQRIVFAHPETEEPLAIEALIPDDMKDVIRKLQSSITNNQTKSKGE